MADAHEVIQLPSPARLRLEELLAELGALDEVPADSIRTATVSVGELVDKAQHAGFGFLLAVLSVIAVPFVGMSTPFGLLVALLGLQMVIGRAKPWLPAAARRRAMPLSTLDRVVTILARRTRWMARLTRRRWGLALRGPLWTLAGLGVALLGFGLALPLPIPGSNLIFMVPIFIYAIGLLEQDGLFIVLGHLGLLANISLMMLFGRTVLEILRAFGGWAGC